MVYNQKRASNDDPSMESPTEDLKYKIKLSDDLLNRARKMLQEADGLPEESERRKWLEEQAQDLFKEAERINLEVTEQTIRLASKVKR
jgi:hypothetical protein